MAELQRLKIIIDGQQVDSLNGRWFESFNPYTGRPWALIPRCDGADVDRAVTAAHHAFEKGEWSHLTPTQRGRLLVRFADLLEEEADRIARIEVQDNGKLLAEVNYSQLKPEACPWPKPGLQGLLTEAHRPSGRHRGDKRLK